MDIDDDEISLSSTIDEANDSEQEWVAEGIIAEGVTDGETRYLVEWTGYPLHDASWEPISHLNEALLGEWAERKGKARLGEIQKFDIGLWREAVAENLRRKYARHERRNARRRREGLDATEWDRSLEDLIQSVNDYSPIDPSEPPKKSIMDQRLKKATATEVPDAQKTRPGRGKPSTKSQHNQQGPLATTSTSAKRVDEGPASQRLLLPKQPSSTTQPPCAVPAVPDKFKPLASQTKSNNKISKTRTQPVENVFIGGNSTKARQPPKDIPGAPAGNPGLQILHYRMSLDKSRNHDNSAPPTVPRNLILLDPNTPNPVPQGGSAQQQSDSSPSPVAMDIDDGSARTPEAIDSTRPPEQGQAQVRGANEGKRKSVSWDDTIQIMPIPSLEDSSKDESLFFQDEPVLSTDAMGGDLDMQASADVIRSPTPPRSSDQKHAAVRQDVQKHNMTRTCLIGENAPRPINLIFQGVPVQTSESWLIDFQDRYRLHFSHSCTAHDFQGQFRRDPTGARIMARGSVLAPTETDTLEMLVGRLKASSKGIISCAPGYCVLIFPTKSEDWKFEASENSAVDGSLLQYSIFLHTLAETDLSKNLAPDADEIRSWEMWLPRGLGHFSGLDYNQIFPSSLQNSAKHHIFLAFPPGSVEESSLLSQWIRVSTNAECIVYDSITPGDWSRFAGIGQGAVVIHEDALWKIRLFPGIYDMLNNPSGGRRYSFSVFHRGCGRPSAISSRSTKKPVTGDVSLRRLYPTWKAFLLTPSFILSEPRQAGVFIDYFVKFYAATDTPHRGKLVIPTDFEDWLVDLIGQRSTRPSHGESRKDMKDMESLVNIIRHISRLTDESTGDDIENPLILVPRGINASDEQSLVNWFGWWSVSNLDWFGRFYVLGSSDVSPEHLTLTMKPVVYGGITSDDPDDHTRSTLSRGNSSVALSPTRISRTSDDGLVPKGGRAVKFTLVEDDSPVALKTYLTTLHSKSSDLQSQVWIYFKPVAYWNGDMAFYHNDIRSVYVTYSQWFDSLLPFDNMTRGNKGKNTMAGFFYTPASEEPAGSPQSRTEVARRPWIGIFRPSNPHRRPWKESELLIWDMGYRGKFGKKQSVHEEDLAECHRQLLRVVNEDNQRKNWTAPLTKVWLGGWTEVDSPYNNAIDTTLHQLDRFIDDFKYWLPAPQPTLEQRGWKLVKEPGLPRSPKPMDMDGGCDKTRQRTDPSASGASNGGEGGENDDGTGPNMILFLPPRGRRMGPKGVSLCKNVLYRRSGWARTDGQESMSFRYMPTMDWYIHQVAEGRDFKHILVEPWTRVFERLRLPTDK